MTTEVTETFAQPAAGPPARAFPAFCSLIPRELLRLAGYRAVEITPEAGACAAGMDRCALNESLCSWARFLAGRLSGPQSPFPLVVVPNSCDALARLRDALDRDTGERRILFLDIPRNSTAAAERYLAGQFLQLAAALGLREETFPAARAQADPAPAEPDASPLGRPDDHRPRVGLCGSVYSEGRLVERLEQAGAAAVVLRRCGRPFPGPEKVLRDPGGSLAEFCRRLAEQYLTTATCPRMTNEAFGEALKWDIARHRLDAVVVPVLKFCDRYHQAVEALEAQLPAGFPVLLVESDLETGFSEQTATRIEALVECLIQDGKSGRPARPVAPRPSGNGHRLALGVDAGSTQVKAVLLEEGGRVLHTTLRPTTGRMADSLQAAVAALLAEAGLARAAISTLGATGYGRKSLAEGTVTTEISCHARGVAHFFPQAATVIDVGGQDSKVIAMDGRGRVLRFAMNDKCAAGTGRFLDATVRALNLDFERFSALSAAAREEVPVTSMCSVFAESEVVSLIAGGAPLDGIVRGLGASIARRVAAMVRRMDGRPPFVLTGGVSRNGGFVRELQRELGEDVLVLEYSPFAGAIGAALLAGQGEA